MSPPNGAVFDAPVEIPDADLLSIEAVAIRFGVHQKTIYRQLADGTFPCRAVKVGRQWRISRTSVDEFLREIEEHR